MLNVKLTENSKSKICLGKHAQNQLKASDNKPNHYTHNSAPQFNSGNSHKTYAMTATNKHNIYVTPQNAQPLKT